MGHLFQRVKRAIRIRIIKRWGSTDAKRLLWDEEFAGGQWDYLERTTDDPVYACIERFGQNAKILDLGCGSGNTGNELDYSKYESYTGVDISAVAVRKAELRSRQNQRDAKNAYVCANIETYSPARMYDLILFRESIFYIPVHKIKGVLDHYCTHLSPGGVFIVRMYDRDKYNPIVDLIRKHYHIIDQCLINGFKDVILVFGPGSASITH